MESFADLLKRYMRNGTGRDAPGVTGKAWSQQEFAYRCNASYRTVYNWLHGRNFPTYCMDIIEQVFFGPDFEFMTREREELRAACQQRKMTPPAIIRFKSSENRPTLQMLVTRTHLHSCEQLTALGVFDLYDRLFPDEQQLSELHFCACLFQLDVGKPIRVIVDGVPMPYHMDSELAVAMVDGTAIGLAFYTYYPNLHFMFFSYIAVDENHRGYSTDFMQAITKRWGSVAQFKECRGYVFEIEPIVTSDVLRIVEKHETTGETVVKDTNDIHTLQALRRLRLYEESAQVYSFVDDATKRPLLYKTPCLVAGLDPKDWEASENEMWLMFCYPDGVELDYSSSAISVLWDHSIRLAIEVIGKSQVALRPARAGAYLSYMNSLLSRLETANRPSTPTIGRFFDDEANVALYKRQRKLKI